MTLISPVSVSLACALSSCSAVAVEPPFVNSIVSTDFDFILNTDPSVLESVDYVGFSRKEMPDKRSNELFANAYVFRARFSDGASVGIWAHEDFGSEAAARVYADLLADAIGQQPAFQRAKLGHVVLHNGDETAFAEEQGRFFVIYSDNMDTRISNNDLQETVFHECAHVSLEADHSTAPGWVEAQQADPGFITAYAEANPVKEDVPESAIFTFVLLNHPGRLPAEVEAVVRQQIPNRVEYLRQIEGFVVDREIGCGGDVNLDGLATPDDFTAWFSAYQTRTAGCDQNADLACSPSDFTAWVVNYNTDC